MTKDVWLGIKQQQIDLYRKRARSHSTKRGLMMLAYVPGFVAAVVLPIAFFDAGQVLAALASLVLIPVSMLVWKISTHENRSKQLLLELADTIEKIIRNGKNSDMAQLRQKTTKVETRFLSNDDELFVKKAIWRQFMSWKKKKRDEEIRYNRVYAQYKSSLINNNLQPNKRWILHNTRRMP